MNMTRGLKVGLDSPRVPRVAGPDRLGMARVSYADVSSILTPASGFMSQYKFTLNPYGGCSFGCEYCYARLFAPTASKGETWGRWVTVKRNACELLASACRAGELRSGDAVYMSSVTDPYQPVERRVGLTRAVLETILASGVQPRLTIQTRSPFATRDVDLFRRFGRVRVNFTITTDSDAVRRRYEPHCPSIEARLEAARAVAAAGVPIGVSVSPMLPIEDTEAFGRRLLALRADEYVTQYLKPARPRFAAGSSAEVLGKVSDAGWTMREYEAARERLADVLSGWRPLLEGAQGYAPP
jgi:DNA repair photolyase